MSAALEDVGASEHALRLVGRGFLQEWDGDKLRHVISKNAAPRYLDGTATLANLVRAVKYRTMPRSSLLPQNLKKALADVRDLGFWVPASEMENAAKKLRDKKLLADVERDGGTNLFTTVGITRLWSNLNAVPAAGAVLSQAQCSILTGDTSTVAAAGNTDLAATVAAANRWAQLLDSNPTVSTNTTTRVATFPTGNGNYTAGWQEWGIDNGTTSAARAATAPLFNRAVANLGVKTTAAAWAFTVTHSIT